ncbi:MAG: AI-2E family transporter [Ruminococcus sp.]|nr:AI-2E family transporter [Ruminococcus sp.]
MRKIIYRYKPQLVFILSFTAVFLIIKLFFIYLLPFIIGFTVSFLMYPVYFFMKKRLSFKPAFSATVITLFIFSIFIALLMFVLYLLISELINLYNNNFELIDKYIDNTDFSSLLSDLSINSDFFSKISDTAFSIFRIIPFSLTLLIISFLATICIINNLPLIKKTIKSKLSDKNAEVFEKVVLKSKEIFKKFIRSYLFLYTLTFVEALFVFVLIDLDYVVVFAFLAAFSDLLPILGPGAVYFPIAVVKIISGDYLSCITLVIFWAITVIIRQIIEPKILSDNIKIHPLIVISALYFSIVSSNIWVLFYIIFLFIAYKIMVESDVLVSAIGTEHHNDDKAC